MTSLIERIESAEGPSRELDADIEIAIAGDREIIIGNKPGRFPQEPIYGTIKDLQILNGNDLADYINAPNYTASIDAALTLVPEGWFVDIQVRPQSLIDKHPQTLRLGSVSVTHPQKVANGVWYNIKASTPALAVCAAALRARGEPA